MPRSAVSGEKGKAMDRGFEGRHVVVTGGTGALGTAVVKALLEAGATCHVPAHRRDAGASGAQVPDERLRPVPGVDLTNEEAVTAFYAQLPDLWASLHLAGGFRMAPIEETRLEDFLQMVEINAVTCFLCCREAVRRLRQGSPEGGRIVNVAARPALVPTGGLAAYSASKAAVVSLTQSLAEEVRAEGILVNAVAPSVIDSPANRQAMPEADHASWPRPEEVAEAILFLASPRNRLTSGAVVPVYGRA